MTPLLLLLLACGSDKGDDTSRALDTGADTGTEEAPTRAGCEPRHDAFIAALQADLDASDAPGVTAAIMEDGEVSCRVALGTKGAETEAPMTIDTLSQIGSTTKMFTAVAMLQKVEGGELSLDDTLADGYPGSEFTLDDTWNDDIQLKHLLHHQGAFYDYVDTQASSDDADLAAWHEDVFFPYIWLMNPPGVFWNYANPNFDIAGLVVESHDDRYYPDLMQQDVFAPLGMARTFQRKSDAEADGDYALGIGYYMTSPTTADYGAVAIDQVPDPAAGRPAGVGTWTTPEQMLHMARFLMEGDTAVLSDALRRQMVEDTVPLQYGGADEQYGYGVFVSPGLQTSDTEYYELPVWSHGGNTNSYSHAFYLVPDQGFAVSIASTGWATDFSSSVIAAITSLCELPAATTPPSYEWDPDRLDLHVGTYTDAYNVGDMIITRAGDGLQIQMPTLDDLGYSVTPDLRTISSDVFLVQIDDGWYDLTFIGGEGDTPSQYMRDRAFVGTRVEGDEARAPAHPDPIQVRRTLDLARLPRAPLWGPRAPR